MGFGFLCVSFILSFGKVRLVVTRRLGFMCVYVHSDPVIGWLSMDVVVGRLSDRLRSLGRAILVAWKESTVKCCCPSVGIDGT